MDNPIIGIDLGGTQIRGALVENGRLSDVLSVNVPVSDKAEEVVEALYRLTDQFMQNSVKAIGIGVPSVVDVEKGIVYDVQNIPSWKEIHLKKILEEKYRVPVFVNNDANCFALGEKYFGQGKDVHAFVGLTLGTGIGAGIIIGDKLYAGVNCGAGEFGLVDYRDQYYEYYASGQFFKNVHRTTGKAVFQQAEKGDKAALSILHEFGIHLGNAIKMILYTYDPEMIILGGSVSVAYPYFRESMWDRIHTLAYPKSLEKFRVAVSTLKHSGVLGAAALCYD